ncbi:uncharacterized protein LOC114290822 isoform X1 [Camellia sinensis]|uniref:uncharacterized protein LOC114290822 isoform X1 n=1 Tax=Camellia sinensis TaxID=4442 RepID=UPI001035F31D|nr:uncharacterized protein LOC114290822 isoform X1 [Camellia sinensis]
MVEIGNQRQRRVASSNSIGRCLISFASSSLTQLSLFLLPSFFPSFSLLSLSPLTLSFSTVGSDRCWEMLQETCRSGRISAGFRFLQYCIHLGRLYWIGSTRSLFLLIISPLLDVILNAEFSMLVIGLCSILTTDPGCVTNESSHHNQLVESPVSVFEAHSEVENVEKPLQLDMSHIINTDIEIIFWSRNWCLQLVTFPTSLLLKKILFHFRESDIVGTARHL